MSEFFYVICCAGKRPCGRRFESLSDWVEHWKQVHSGGRRLPDFLQKILDSPRQGM